MDHSELEKFDRVEWIAGAVGPLRAGALGYVVEPVCEGKVLARWDDPENQRLMAQQGVLREDLKLIDQA